MPINHPSWVFWILSGLSAAAAALVVSFPHTVSHAVFVPLLVIAGLFLSGPTLVRSLGIVLIAYCVAAAATWGVNAVAFSVLMVMALTVLIVAPLTHNRVEASVPLTVGSGMLAELRQRLDTQAQIPDLPDGYAMEAHVMPARGGGFSGDFVATARRGDTLSVALTDVSGHGPSAATRALLLSGALSGLLGETDPEHFLPAANRYVIRQGWRDGFASCVHVALNLESGDFCVGSAGHPAAAHYHAADDRWELLADSYGLLLGVFEQDEADYQRAGGHLEPGDAIVLYTDGVVEGSGGDLVAGTHQMLRSAQKAMERHHMHGAAQRICAVSAALGGDDDRSAVVIWRSPQGAKGEAGQAPVLPPAIAAH